MESHQTDLAKVLTTNHPARPYLIMGGLVAGLGLMRQSGVGLVMMILGGGLIYRGMEEVQRVNQLHGGNYHGVNAPPANR